MSPMPFKSKINSYLSNKIANPKDPAGSHNQGQNQRNTLIKAMKIIIYLILHLMMILVINQKLLDKI